jgi:hypothetical protein
LRAGGEVEHHGLPWIAVAGVIFTLIGIPLIR